jgi:hypothetical protein
VIYNGVSSAYDESDLVWELNYLAGRRVRLREQGSDRLDRYGFGSDARAAVTRLACGFCEVSSLLGGDADVVASGGETVVLKVLYTLLVTEMLEVEARVKKGAGAKAGGPLAFDLPRAESLHAAHPAPARRSLPPPSIVRPSDPLPSRKPAQPMPIAEPRPVAVAAAPGARPETLERFRKGSRPPAAEATDHESDPRALEGRTRFLRGEAYLRRGDVEMALCNLKAAHSLLPDDPDIEAMLAAAVWRDPSTDEAARDARARRHLAAALKRCPTCARALRVLGQIHADKGELDQAIRCWGKVCILCPDDTDTAHQLKRLEKKRGNRAMLGIWRRR